MATLDNRLDRLEQLTAVHSYSYKILMHHEGEPKQVIPDYGQLYIVVTFVKPKQWEPDHDET